DAQLAEVFTRGTVVTHVVVRQQRKAGVGATGTVRVDGILRETREARHRVLEGLTVIGIARDTRHDGRIATLHGTSRTAHRHHTAGSTHRDVIQPARAHLKMLHHTDGTIRTQSEAGYTHAIDVGF